MLNDLLAEADLAKLSQEQRDFLVQRLDHAIDTDAQIRQILATKLQATLELVSKGMKVKR